MTAGNHAGLLPLQRSQHRHRRRCAAAGRLDSGGQSSGVVHQDRRQAEGRGRQPVESLGHAESRAVRRKRGGRNGPVHHQRRLALQSHRHDRFHRQSGCGPDPAFDCGERCTSPPKANTRSDIPWSRSPRPRSKRLACLLFGGDSRIISASARAAQFASSLRGRKHPQRTSPSPPISGSGASCAC